MSSSDDSLPVIRRQVVDDVRRNSAEKLKRKRVAVLLDDSSSEESDLPSWLRNDQQAGEPEPERGEEVDDRAPTTRRSDDRDRRSGEGEPARTTTGSARRKGSGSEPDRSKGTPMIYLLSSSDSDDDRPLAARKAELIMEDLPATQVDDLGTQQATELATEQETQPTQLTQATQLTQPTTQETPSTAKKSLAKKQQKGSNAKKLSPGTVNKGDKKSINVVVPDRLPGSKLIMELEANHAIASATDLSGDTGAIGRILRRTVAAADDESTLDCHELDLKGRMYTVTPVEFPGTIMVLNFTGEEAKVESVMESFIQIREDARFRNEENEEKMRAWMEDDDDSDGASGAGVKARGAKATKAVKTTKTTKATKTKPKAAPTKPAAKRTAPKKRPAKAKAKK